MFEMIECCENSNVIFHFSMEWWMDSMIEISKERLQSDQIKLFLYDKTELFGQGREDDLKIEVKIGKKRNGRDEEL